MRGEGGSGVLSDVVAVAAGRHFSLALKSDGTVVAWGGNSDGQLGMDTGISGAAYPHPVAGLSHLAGIAAGARHALALTVEGYVFAWGYNYYGQLGNWSTTASSTPVLVYDQNEPGGWLMTVVAIAAGGYHSLALQGDGALRAWGRNDSGQLGDDRASGNYASTAQPVAGLSGVVAVRAGELHSLALKADGTVHAWGKDDRGQLGDGSSGTGARTTTPVPVLSPDGSGVLGSVVALGAGWSHSLAVQRAGAGPIPSVAVSPTPQGDSFGQALAVAIPDFTSGSTAGATTEAGEPSPAAGPSLKTVWFRAVPAETGTLSASTEGSAFDTVLALWTGNSLQDLGEVASSDDYAPPEVWSRIDAPVEAGRTYYLQLGGFAGDSGPFRLQVSLTLAAPAATATPTATAAAPSTTTPTSTATRTATPPTSPASPTATPGPWEQRIPLHRGWNWFSFAVAPTAGAWVAEVLASIAGKYDYVLGERGTYAAPPALQQLNTLATLEPGTGYFLRMKEAAELRIAGWPLPPDTPIHLGRGWHWIGYLPAEARNLPTALDSIAGRHDYLLGEAGTYAPPPARQQFNTLFRMEPGRGYLIRMREQGTLTYSP